MEHFAPGAGNDLKSGGSSSNILSPAESQSIPMRPGAITTQTYPARPLNYHTSDMSARYGTWHHLSTSAYYQQLMRSNTPSYLPPSSFSSSMNYATTLNPNDFPSLEPLPSTSIVIMVLIQLNIQHLQALYNLHWKDATQCREKPCIQSLLLNSLSPDLQETVKKSILREF